jgi:hypothetical protein
MLTKIRDTCPGLAAKELPGYREEAGRTAERRRLAHLSRQLIVNRPGRPADLRDDLTALYCGLESVLRPDLLELSASRGHKDMEEEMCRFREEDLIFSWQYINLTSAPWR